MTPGSGAMACKSTATILAASFPCKRLARTWMTGLQQETSQWHEQNLSKKDASRFDELFWSSYLSTKKRFNSLTNLAPTSRSSTQVYNFTDRLKNFELVIYLHQLKSAPDMEKSKF